MNGYCLFNNMARKCGREVLSLQYSVLKSWSESKLLRGQIVHGVPVGQFLCS